MQHPQELIRRARVLESAGQYEAALDAYLRIIASADEPDTHLLARAGVLHLRVGQVDEAARTLAGACDRYAEAGLHNNALALCQRLLRADPGHAEFLLRLAELGARLGYREDARQGSIGYADALNALGDATAAAEPLRAHLQRFPDDAEVLTRLEAIDAPPPPPQPPPAAHGPSPADDLGLLTNAPEEIAGPDVRPVEGLEATRVGEEWAAPPAAARDDLPLLGNAPDGGMVERTPTAGNAPPGATPSPAMEDPESYYDLGVAFKEMGLWDDAIGQLQDALRAGASPLATMEVLGECYLGRGEPDLATRVLLRAAKLEAAEPRDLLGVHYWLGRAHEAAAAARPARDCYRRVVEIDPGFRDAAARIAALEPA